VRRAAREVGDNVRRLARHLFTLCSALSLLLCVIALPMWPRSVLHTDYVGVRDAGWHLVQIRSGHATIGFSVDPRIAPPLQWNYEGVAIQGDRPWLGSAYFDRGYYGVIAYVPYWSFLCAAAVLPAAWLVRRAQNARRARRGRCAVCGYDLRASPERCPECGRAAK
jgi:hypothetical protein